MLEKLKAAMARYEQITAALANPLIANDLQKFRDLLREQKQLTVTDIINLINNNISKEKRQQEVE